MVERRWMTGMFVAVLAASAPASAGAQLAFDTPRMLGPSSPRGLGVQWLRAGTLPGDGDALLVTWNPPGLSERLTLRGGTGDGALGARGTFGGFDWRAPLARRGPGRPLDVAWTTGAGVGVGEYALVTVPAGLTVGRSWSAGRVWVAPYVSAGASLDYRIGAAAPDDRFGVSPTADVGVDLALDPGRRFVFRAAASLGDRQAVAVGVLVRTGG